MGRKGILGFKNSRLTKVQNGNLRHLIIANINLISNNTTSYLIPLEKTALKDPKSNDSIVWEKMAQRHRLFTTTVKKLYSLFCKLREHIFLLIELCGEI